MDIHNDTLCVRDDTGEITISYGEMLKYHGRDFYGGVALAFKVLKLAFVKLIGKDIPHRNQIRLVVGFNPPGVIDGLEFVTRALTRQRLILDPDPQKGPESVFGRYSFEVQYGSKKISLWLKSGILPDEFTLLARKAFAGIASSDELGRWKGYKESLGRDIMAIRPEELLDFDQPVAISER
jgi:hypothetical protein